MMSFTVCKLLTHSAAWSLGFTFDDFSCVADVASERVWVKKPGEENNIKSKHLERCLFIPSLLLALRSRPNQSDKWPGNQAAQCTKTAMNSTCRAKHGV